MTLAQGAPRPPARVADFAWLTGSWTGEGLGGRIDEVWSRPDGGAMVGYWEEKNGFVTFRLVQQDATGAYFSGLTFRRINPDLLEGDLALRNRADGTVREEKLVYRRAK